ncbi:MAG: Methionine aminopeptidase [Candidatus Yanofskybacteria bacterium GW2011_GWA1_39_13]|uniref:Methionine aminopeptidase n=1 Tax=Yanofskybacteria sp. (strain GW2011_GWA1_39_13) TaxID=1619019 RepID=A0A0G0PW05_YANXG|nr:MAG: Methionine aminopeptidase [Candidatus Yanofskybacteria bacterium GW2011_GWA1_39_13]
MVNIKTEKEIQIMKEGGKVLGEILNKLADAVKPGMTTNDLEKLARELVLSYGVESSFLGFDGYPAFLCTSINDEIVHGLPSDRILDEGDVLKIDMGVLHKGFHTDSAVTVLVGNKGDAIKRSLIQTTKESLEIGISKARVGNTLGDVGSAIQKHIEDKGFNVVRDLVGHGIGKELHEPPQVLNYGKAGTGEKLISGMVIAIEPMVVTGKWGIKNGKDGYAFVTKDGGLAAHFEHTIVITDAGPLVITK